MKNHSVRYFFCRVLLTISAGIISISAFAQGTVTKQKKCTLIVDGVSGLTKGQSVSVTPQNGTAAEAKVIAFKASKAALELDSSRCGENFQGATLSATSVGTNKAKTGAKNTKRFSVNLQGGYSSTNLVRQEGTASSLPYAGPELAAEFRFIVPVGAKFGISLAVGGGWQSKTVMLSNTTLDGTVQKYDQSWSAPFARGGAGAQFDVTSKIRVGGLGFFDFGFGGSLAKKGDVNEKKPITGNMRYGAALEGDFAIITNLRAGANGNFYLGSLKLKEVDATSGEEIKTSQSFSGFGGNLKISFDF